MLLSSRLHWRTGLLNSVRLANLLILSATVGILNTSDAFAATSSTVSVTSQNTTGSTVTGYYTTLYDQTGGALAEGFTPTSFAVTAGQTYEVGADGYGSCVFQQWSDGVTSDPRTFTASSSGLVFTAVYNCGGSSSPSSLMVNSVDQNGASISGYYVILFDSAGNEVANGFTPATFSTVSGESYGVQADGYGTCVFSHWSNGATNDPLTITATGSTTTLTATYTCSSESGGSTTTISVTGSNSATGQTLDGYYIALYQGDSVVGSGFTPTSFTVTSGQVYSLQADGYGGCTFDSWSGIPGYGSNAESADPISFTAPAASDSIQATYLCSSTIPTSTYTGQNWAGYIVDGPSLGSVTNVTASWVVPSVSCGTDSYATVLEWVGIDGWSSNTVEQIGVSGNCSLQTAGYSVFYEFWPAEQVMYTNMTIHAGDLVTASVSGVAATKQFTLTLTDSNTKQTTTIHGSAPNAELSSAEWVVEAPTMGSNGTTRYVMANFGSMQFNNDYATINGQTESLISWAGNSGSAGTPVTQATYACSGGNVKAQPSTLTETSDSFSTTWFSGGSC